MDTLSSDTKEECKMVRTSVTQVLDSNELNPKNFSDFRRLVRVTACMGTAFYEQLQMSTRAKRSKKKFSD